MTDYYRFFKGKQVTLMGLGLLGRGVGDAVFLAECGAELTVTDLRDEKTLAPSLKKLKQYKNIRFTLGEHKKEDFSARGGQAQPDFILKAAGVPLDSPYIAEARKRGIPIEMDASLFAKLMPPGVTLVGVTGTRGKSTVTALIYEILKTRFKIYDLRFKKVKSQKSKVKGSPRVFRGGNLVPEATLPLLKKVRSGDIVVLELDSWQLQGFHDAKISPHVAVFTTFLDDHLIYYRGNREKYFSDKSAIFKYQNKGDTLVVGEQSLPRFNLKSGKRLNLGGSVVVARAADIPRSWKPRLLGEHNRENIACALAAARSLGVPDRVSRAVIERFPGIPGRLEYLRTIRLPAVRGSAQAGGVRIYNDNNATTPDATVAALKALRDLRFRNNDLRIHKSKIINHKSIILIMGGTDKGLDVSKLVAEIPKHCKAVVLLQETGTTKFLEVCSAKRITQSDDKDSLTLHATRYMLHKTPVCEMETLESCVKKSIELARPGDIVLFSPAFASFGKWFKNEYDRGNQFVELINKL